jgi:hypothetical protein
MSDAEGDVDKLFESSDEDEAKQPQHSQGTADDDAAPNQLRGSQPDGSEAQQASSPIDDGSPAAQEPVTANRCVVQPAPGSLAWLNARRSHPATAAHGDPASRCTHAAH